MTTAVPHAAHAGVGLIRTLRAGLQPAARLEPGYLRFSEIPKFASLLGIDLVLRGELAQPFMADLQFVGGDRERDQAVLLRHERDSNGYAKSLPRLVALSDNNCYSY